MNESFAEFEMVNVVRRRQSNEHVGVQQPDCHPASSNRRTSSLLTWRTHSNTGSREFFFRFGGDPFTELRWSIKRLTASLRLIPSSRANDDTSPCALSERFTVVRITHYDAMMQ